MYTHTLWKQIYPSQSDFNHLSFEVTHPSWRQSQTTLKMSYTEYGARTELLQAAHGVTVGRFHSESTQVPFLPSSLIQSKRHYVGGEQGSCPVGVGAVICGGLRSPPGVRRHLHSVWYSSDSSGMNRASVSGVAETRFSLEEKRVTNTWEKLRKNLWAGLEMEASGWTHGFQCVYINKSRCTYLNIDLHLHMLIQKTISVCACMFTHKLTDMFPDFLQRRPGNADTLIAVRTPATESLLSQRSREGSRWAWNTLYQKVIQHSEELKAAGKDSH